MAWVDPRDLRDYDVIELVRRMIEESARRV